MALLVLSSGFEIDSVADGSLSPPHAIRIFWSAAFMVFFGSMSLHSIECRYLFFADPRNYAEMLAEPEWNPRELWLDTYWHLPCQILAIMLHSRRLTT
ncbi:MAG: hypothetical protein E6J42_10125 [Chloroflexi bacterium]|nr:MAG: hypothetical protein E6J42_10125 [Chloroflexota bacterium]